LCPFCILPVCLGAPFTLFIIFCYLSKKKLIQTLLSDGSNISRAGSIILLFN
jgi:hypothetical protein